MQRIKRSTFQYFPATLKLLTMCMKPDVLNTILKAPDDFSKYVKFLINYQGRKLENIASLSKKKFSHFYLF